MSEIKKIDNYIKNLKRRQFFRTYGIIFVRYLIFLTILTAFLTGLTAFFEIPGLYMKLIFYGTWGIITGGLIYKLYKIHEKKVLSLRYIFKEIEQKFPEEEDIIINAKSLWNNKNRYDNPVAKEVIARVMQRAKEVTDSIEPSVLNLKQFFRESLKLGAIILTGVILIASGPPAVKGLFTEFKEKVFTTSQYYISVSPVSRQVSMGDSVNIDLKTNWHSPVLKIERMDSTYTEPADKTGQESFSYKIKNIESEIKFRVEIQAGRKSSKWYKIEPVYPPQVEEISLKYIYPDYTNREPETVKDRRIEALRGTRVRLNIKATRNIKEGHVKTGGEKHYLTLVDNKKMETSFVLEEQKNYTVFLKGEDGIQNKGNIQYPIDILVDRPPEVDLIYPEEYLKVSPDARVKIEGEFSDDVGVEKLYLIYYLGIGGQEKQIRIKSFEEAEKSAYFNYNWDISDTDATEGGLINYRIKVVDNNSLYGPGTGYSYEQQLEIKGFREKHDKVMEDVKEIQDKILKSLEKSYELEGEVSKENFKKAEENLENTFEELENLKDFSEKLTESMSDDPYTREDTRAEFESMEEMTKELLENKVPSVKEALQKNDKGRAAKNSGDITKNLERMMRIAEDTAKRQKMSDLNSTASDSLEKARELSDALKEDNVTPQNIVNKLQKLQNLMEEMQKMVSKFPDELPEEFINKESIKNTDFEKPGENMDSLMKALQEGDYEKASRLMDEMVNSLKNIMENINTASSEIMDNQQEKFDNLSSELQNKIKDKIEKQEKLLEKTVSQRDELSEQKEKYGEKKLEDLKQEFQVLKSTLNLRNQKTQEIDREFSKEYLYRTEEYLDEIKENLSEDWKREKLEKFKESLKEQPDNENLMNSKNLQSLKNMSEEQLNIKEGLEEVKEGMSAMEHFSALMKTDLPDNIEKAAGEMGNSANKLEKVRPGDSVVSQRKALSYLKDADNSMSRLRQSMEKLSQQSQAGGGYTFKRSMGRSGRRGAREGHVEIPGITDKIEDEEYRKLILEALKEEHPAEYKKLIEEYFKSLSE
ncbi:MAG: DUF4175 family protein [Elusimicrobiota bacterium]